MRKNIEFSSDDPILILLFEEVLNRYFLSEKARNPTAQGRLLEAKEYKISNDLKPTDHLKQSELTKNLLKPYIYKTPFNPSENYCIILVALLQKLRSEKQLWDENDIITKFQKHYQTKTGIKQRQQQFSLLGDDEFELQEFDKTEWWLFERTGDHPSRNSKWGIAVGKISFACSGKTMFVTASFYYQDEQIIEDKGIATHDDNKAYLYIDLLSTDGTQKRSSLTLKLTDMHRDKQEIMAGHFTYHSVSYQHLVSKTVILQKKIAGSPIRIGDFQHDNEAYNNIPEEIRQFLYPRESNRMSLPKRIINDLKNLRTFLDRNREEKLSTTIKSHFLGKYLVYYMTQDNVLIEDKLEILKNQQAIHLECIYRHYTDQERTVPKYFFGRPFRNDDKIVIELSNEKTKEDNFENPVLLTFNLPANYKNSQCFPGVLSNLNDDLKPSGYIVLVVKSSVKEDLPNYEQLVADYFKHLEVNRLTAPDDYFMLS